VSSAESVLKPKLRFWGKTEPKLVFRPH